MFMRLATDWLLLNNRMLKTRSDKFKLYNLLLRLCPGLRGSFAKSSRITFIVTSREPLPWLPNNLFRAGSVRHGYCDPVVVSDQISLIPVHLIPDLVLEKEFLSDVGHHEEDDAAADDEADDQDPILPSHWDDNKRGDLEGSTELFKSMLECPRSN